MKTLIMVQKHNNNAFDKFLFLAMKAFILARALFPKESYLGGIRNAIQSNTFFSDIQEDSHKVNRCLARYSPRATTTSQPTTRTLNKPAMNKNANFGPNLVVFGQRILFFTGEIKSFVTHITENQPRHLVHIAFWSGIGQNMQKMAIFGRK